MTTNSTSQVAPSSITVVVLNFRHYQKNSLRGFATLALSPPDSQFTTARITSVTMAARGLVGRPGHTQKTTKRNGLESLRLAINRHISNCRRCA